MTRKNTIASIRIKQELEEKSLTGTELAKLADISYYTVENILSGKSSKIDKIEAIARVLGKPLMYFIDPKFDTAVNKNSNYDGELHYKTIKIINDICKKKKIFLTKEKMDNLVDTIYPRLNKKDSEELIIAQSEAIIDYITKQK